MTKPRKLLYFTLNLTCLLVLFGLTACGIRPYDYLAPPLKTISAPFKDSPTAQPSPTRIFASTPSPAASNPSAAPTFSATPQIITPTAVRTQTPVLEGTTRLILQNRSRNTLIVTLQGKDERGFELNPAATYSTELPAGVYAYWIIQPGAQSLRGEIALPPGFFTWTLFDTPTLVDSPTPKWSPSP